MRLSHLTSTASAAGPAQGFNEKPLERRRRLRQGLQDPVKAGLFALLPMGGEERKFLRKNALRLEIIGL